MTRQFNAKLTSSHQSSTVTVCNSCAKQIKRNKLLALAVSVGHTRAIDPYSPIPFHCMIPYNYLNRWQIDSTGMRR